VTTSELILLATIQQVKETLKPLHCAGKKIGFVPTMGYLHQGHLSLVEKARQECEIVVVSIFVNPTQFSPGEDLSRYPRNIESDLERLRELGVDYVFTPTNQEMYHHNHLTWINVEKLSDRLCGKSRVGHFQGVATVVLKLINVVRPDAMYMGEKDFQQLLVLEKMINDLDLDTRIVRCPTVREQDGLAMSSRNSYLSPAARQRALSLHNTLQMAQNTFTAGETEVESLLIKMKEHLSQSVDKIDYIEIVDNETLEPINNLNKHCRVLIAAFVDGTRLIDNIEIL